METKPVIGQTSTNYNILSNCSKLNFNLDFEVARLRDCEAAGIRGFGTSRCPVSPQSRRLAVSSPRGLVTSSSRCLATSMPRFQYVN